MLLLVFVLGSLFLPFLEGILDPIISFVRDNNKSILVFILFVIGVGIFITIMEVLFVK
jgi:hypothetical protein